MRLCFHEKICSAVDAPQGIPLRPATGPKVFQLPLGEFDAQKIKECLVAILNKIVIRSRRKPLNGRIETNRISYLRVRIFKALIGYSYILYPL